MYSSENIGKKYASMLLQIIVLSKTIVFIYSACNACLFNLLMFMAILSVASELLFK